MLRLVNWSDFICVGISESWLAHLCAEAASFCRTVLWCTLRPLNIYRHTRWTVQFHKPLNFVSKSLLPLAFLLSWLHYMYCTHSRTCTPAQIPHASSAPSDEACEWGIWLDGCLLALLVCVCACLCVCISGGSCDDAHGDEGNARGRKGEAGGGWGDVVNSLSSLFPLHLALPFFHPRDVLLWVQYSAAERNMHVCSCVCVCVWQHITWWDNEISLFGFITDESITSVCAAALCAYRLSHTYTCMSF